MENFNILQEEIFSFLCKVNPVNSTSLGIDTYDGSLANFDEESLLKSQEQRQIFINRLINVDRSKLSANEIIDYDMLKNELDVTYVINEKSKVYYRNSTIYLDECFYGVYLLILRSSDNLNNKLDSIISRIQDIPKVLNAGKANLIKGENIPKLWTEISIKMADDGISFFENLISEFFNNQIPKEYEEKFNNAIKTTLDAITDFKKFLENELLAKSNGSFALGEDLFNYILKTKFHLPYNTDELLKIGQRMLLETENSLIETAKIVNPNKSWQEIIKEEISNSLLSGDLLEHYKTEIQKVKKYLIEKDIITIPSNDILEIVNTPVFQRQQTPYAAYIPPAPFAKDSKAYFWVTPITDDLTEEEKLDRLKAHNKYTMQLTTVHESYPGHHQQYVVTNENASKVRKFTDDTAFVEGWALYWEENIYSSGFSDSPIMKLMQLRDQIWRCCRVIIDVELHRGNMTFDEAVNMLVEKAEIENLNAIAEVERYTLSPTQPMSYIIGKYQILELREALKEKMGDKFTMKYFHDTLLSFGPIPLPLIKNALL